jgi:hypothetical protein
VATKEFLAVITAECPTSLALTTRVASTSGMNMPTVLETLKKDLERVTKKFGPDDPSVMDLRQQIAALESTKPSSPQDAAEWYSGAMRKGMPGRR